MNVYKPGKIRNIALLGHSGSGKTTLAETMLFESGTIKRRGTINDGNTVSDFQQVEKEKLKSVFTSFLHLDWRGHKINIIDTPGTADYISEVIPSLQVAGNALFVLDAEHGVEVGTEVLWNYARNLNIPSIIVVNKVDSPNSNFQNTVDQARDRFGREVVVIQYPYGEGEEFNTIIDVLKMTMYEFPEDGGKPDKLPIPDSQRTRAELLHNELIEAIAENDEMLMDLYFEKGTLGEFEMVDGLRSAMKNGQIFPLFCTSAEKNMGTGRVMGFIDTVIPAPIEENPVVLMDGKELPMDPEAKSAIFLFKNVYEDHVGELMYFKVYSGFVKTGMDLINSATSNTSRLGTLFMTQGNKRQEISEFQCGDIGAVVKLKDCHANETLHEKGFDVELPPIIYPEPNIRAAIRNVKTGDEEKLGTALNQLHKENPALHVDHNQELKQLIISGQGEEHLAIVKYMLTNRFKVDVELYEPRIPYRETITKPVKATYKHKKQTGGAGQYAEVYLYVEPWHEGMPDPPDMSVRDRQLIELPWGGKLEFLNCIVGGVIDNRFMPAILKGVMDKMENGPLSNCRVRDVRVAVYDGSMHSVDSNEAAFKTAGLMAFKKAFLDASPQLLEPVYDVNIAVPSDYMGDVLGDLSTRRGQILGMDADGSVQKIKAKIPLAELNKYATHLKSMTQGRATHSLAFSDYSSVPRDIQEKVMKETLDLEEA
ncbi:MAG: elongation factor G [Rhodothermaceae bacterium]|nr:elongation factor G [Rhodothermaceae bacterium]